MKLLSGRMSATRSDNQTTSVTRPALLSGAGGPAPNQRAATPRRGALAAPPTACLRTVTCAGREFASQTTCNEPSAPPLPQQCRTAAAAPSAPTLALPPPRTARACCDFFAAALPLHSRTAAAVPSASALALQHCRSSPSAAALAAAAAAPPCRRAAAPQRRRATDNRTASSRPRHGVLPRPAFLRLGKPGPSPWICRPYPHLELEGGASCLARPPRRVPAGRDSKAFQKYCLRPSLDHSMVWKECE